MWFALAGALLVLAWLLPVISSPVVTFPSEWLAAAGWLVLVAGVLRSAGAPSGNHLRRGGWRVMAPFAALALIAGLHGLLGFAANAQTSLLAMIYLGFGACVAFAGHVVAQRGSTDLLQQLGWALLVAAGLNAILGWLQYLVWPQGMAPWLVPLRDAGRVYGNLRQPNFYMVLLSWGALAALALGAAQVPQAILQRRLLWVAASMLAASAALAGSRLGLVVWVTVGVLALVWRRLPSSIRVGLGLAALSHVGTWLALLTLQKTLGLDYFGSVRVETAEADWSGSRALLWQQMVTLFTSHPWFGTGWGRLNEHYARSLELPELLSLDVTHAHNFVLHWLVELGAPATLFVLALCVWPLWRAARSVPATFNSRWVLGGILTISVAHSLVDWPWWFSMFLAPTAFCFGYLCCEKENNILLEEPTSTQRLASRGPLLPLAGMALLVWLGQDYQHVTSLFSTGKKDVIAAIEQGYRSSLFSHYVDYGVVTNTPVRPDNARQHERLSGKVARFRSDRSVLTQRLLAALYNGQSAEAGWLVRRLQQEDEGHLARVRAQALADPELTKRLNEVFRSQGIDTE